jgi:hypothetical protein
MVRKNERKIEILKVVETVGEVTSGALPDYYN